MKLSGLITNGAMAAAIRKGSPAPPWRISGRMLGRIDTPETISRVIPYQAALSRQQA